MKCQSVVTLLGLAALLYGLASVADAEVLYEDKHGIRLEYTATDTEHFTRCDNPDDPNYHDRKLKIWKVSLKITNGSGRRIEPQSTSVAHMSVKQDKGSVFDYQNCHYSHVANLHKIDGQDDQSKFMFYLGSLVYAIPPGRTLSNSSYMYLFEDQKPLLTSWQFGGYTFSEDKPKKPPMPPPSRRPAVQTTTEANPDKSTPPARRGSSGSLILLVDVSGSMQGDKLISAKRAATDTIRKAIRNKSEVAILAFEGECDDPIDRSIGFSRDEAALVAFVNGLSAQGGTPLATALETTNRFMKQHRAAASRAQMILLLADGDDDCGGLDDVLRKLKRQNLLYRHETVGLEVSGDAQEQLQNIARQSGGNYHHATSQNLSQVFSDAVDLMRMLDMLGNFN